MLPIFANKIFKPIFLLIGLSCYCTGHSQIQNRICDTIPYEIRYNRLIIPVEVNGIKNRYIIDTGGQTATVASIAVKVDAQAQGLSLIHI